MKDQLIRIREKLFFSNDRFGFRGRSLSIASECVRGCVCAWVRGCGGAWLCVRGGWVKEVLKDFGRVTMKFT